MDIAITKMRSKGRIDIPEDMRDDIKEGEKLVIIKNKDQIILKKAEAISKNLEEDLIFAKRTEEALKKYEKGKFIEMDFEEFMEEAKTW
ncbi:MAG: hypothetical protein AMQ74_01126 [Candidatus Methanofastidiosum methylothiophilum]|uniref:SpoVT / AbrB like domain protein n=1 Tax=Candidatus Methanofastidiosum methylothiophilum TaxID=1705564 RepID=A0A150J2Y7_9EURY|nr:MAG: hypothetical protein AMQ74_01126 [Candidatus Methanofastidiosum methylthiophilus]NMC76607.1 AbrB/MazE/SpoVT family DNA-binding domain-containing protein [Candidatus Methanofastidiosa archaeon]